VKHSYIQQGSNGNVISIEEQDFSSSQSPNSESRLSEVHRKQIFRDFLHELHYWEDTNEAYIGVEGGV
jgi:hypothetical protein